MILHRVRRASVFSVGLEGFGMVMLARLPKGRRFNPEHGHAQHHGPEIETPSSKDIRTLRRLIDSSFWVRKG